MKLTKISVPFGAIGIIYEARPNVSFDVFSLLPEKRKCLCIEKEEATPIIPTGPLSVLFTKY